MCLCWQVTGHLVIAMLLMTSCYGQPTWTTNISRPEVHSLSFYFHCLSGLEVMQQLTSSENTLTDAKDTKTTRVCSGWVSGCQKLSEEDVTTYTSTHTHSDKFLLNGSDAEVDDAQSSYTFVS